MSDVKFTHQQVAIPFAVMNQKKSDDASVQAPKSAPKYASTGDVIDFSPARNPPAYGADGTLPNGAERDAFFYGEDGDLGLATPLTATGLRAANLKGEWQDLLANRDTGYLEAGEAFLAKNKDILSESFLKSANDDMDKMRDGRDPEGVFKSLGDIEMTDDKKIRDLEMADQGSRMAGLGIAYKGSKVQLPGELNELQKTQQVNFLEDANPPIYVTSDNSSPIKYSAYTADGKPMSLKDQTGPLAIGLNNGEWFSVNEGGVGFSDSIKDPKFMPKETAIYDLNGASNGIIAKRTDIAFEDPAHAYPEASLILPPIGF